MVSNVVFLIPALPLLGFLLNGLFGKALGKRLVAFIACGTVLVSFILSLLVFAEVTRLPSEERSITMELTDWITAGQLEAPLAFLVDPLSVVMILVVTGVGFLIHVYAVGYMGHDPGFSRFFAYLNLFTGAMLLLVLADNYLLTFVGWEGVGLCSYLLIGFWYERDTARAAAKKAFIVNRIGDTGYLLAMFLLFATFGSLRYLEVNQAVLASRYVHGGKVIDLITLLLFLGCVGKSAQLPLYVWLPDAMEGPTPVSALIHAATMVTSGVYLIARSHVLFQISQNTSSLVAIIGALTAIYAATIALAQFDIKRVLAFSTVSQLGYMFLGVGMGAYVGASGYAAGMFHLVTQAFVKALLFLGAGSVIHALHDTQDMRQMGGLWPKLRLTGTTMLVASLAISGFPLLSGFFSKDEVLFQAFAGGKYLLWAVGLLTALLTAFYMFRLFSLTFLGKPRDQHLAEAAHESPLVMTVPLLALAALSIVGGFIGWPGSTGSALEHFLEPALHSTELDRVLSLEPAHPNKVLLAVLSAVVGLAGIALGLRTYWRRQIPDPVQERLGGAFDLMGRQYQLDDAYRAVAVGGGNALCQVAADHLDQGGIDWLVNAAARATGAAGRWLRLIQSGLVRHYALAVALGVVGIMVYLAIRVMS